MGSVIKIAQILIEIGSLLGVFGRIKNGGAN